MSVLECARPGCNHTMCDFYISPLGYLCYDCQQEFIKYMESRGKIDATEGEIYEELVSFMSVQNLFPDGKHTNIYYFFEQHKVI